MKLRDRVREMSMPQYLVTAYVIAGTILSVGMAVKKVT